MHPSVGVGRGAPEIDALEASVDMVIGLGTASQSYQIVRFHFTWSKNSYLLIYEC